MITASRPVRRHAAAAQAVEEEPEDHLDAAYPPDPYPSDDHHAPSTDSYHDDNHSNTRARRTEHVSPPWTQLPPGLSKRLASNQKMTAIDFQNSFIKQKLQPGQLAQLPTLDSVLSIYLKYAEPSQWAWLAGQLGHMLDEISAANLSDFHHDVPDLGHTIRAYCLAELGQTTEARIAMKSVRFRSSMALVHALQGIILQKLGHEAGTRREMSTAIRRGVSRSGYWMTTAFLDCVARFTQEGSQEDIMAVMLDGGNDFIRLFIDSKRHRVDRHDRLVEIWTNWLATVPVSVTMTDSTYVHKQIQRIQFPILANDPKRTRETIDLFIHMKQNNELKHVRSSDVIALFGNLIALDQVQAALFVFDEIRQIRELTHERLSPLLYHLSTANGDVKDRMEELWKLLNDVAEPTYPDCRAIAKSRAKAGDLSGVRAAYARLTSPDTKIQSGQNRLLLQAAIQGGYVEEAIHYLELVLGYQPGIRPFNQVFEMLLRRQEDDRALELHARYISNSTIKPDSHTFTSLIAMYARRRDVQAAETTLQSMLDSGLVQDAATSSAMLNAYVESGDWKGVVQYWESIPEEHKRANSVVATTMKAMVLQSSPLSPILAMFRAIERPTTYHWAMVLQSASDNTNLEATEALFMEMQHASRQSIDAVKPNVHAWSIRLHAHLRANNVQRSQTIYDEMLANGIVPSSVTYSMIIRSYAESDRSGTLQRAEEFAMAIYRLANEQNTAERFAEDNGARGQTYENLLSPLVAAAGQAGQPELAGEFFELIAKKENSSIPLYTQYLDAWRKAQDGHMVKLIWTELFALACRTVAPTPSNTTNRNLTTRISENVLCVPLSIVLVTFGKEKRLLDIKETWNAVREAGFGFDVGNFNHLAVSLAHSGDVEGAFDVVENVLVKNQEDEIVDRLRDLVPHATGPAFRPPNRRPESNLREPVILRSDRTSEILDQLTALAKQEAVWRPHFNTIATLDTLVSQLETAESNRAWLGLMSEEAEAEEEGEGEGSVVMLHSFDNCVRDAETGKPKKTSAKGLLMKLNRKYAKAMALVMFHRKKQASLTQNPNRRGNERRVAQRAKRNAGVA
jgi:pentatricopeptide repeat-containing protein PET309